jgi:hypothetical protein
MLSLLDRVVLLPIDIQELIHRKLHSLYVNDIKKNITLFSEIQEFWKLMKRISILCILDFIDEHTHLVFCPFYTSINGNFQKPDLKSFMKVIETQFEYMTSFTHFEEYMNNELQMLFTNTQNSYLWLGQHLQNNAIEYDEICKAKILYYKFSKTKIAKQIPRNLFHKLVVLEQDSIMKDILDMYFDPNFEIF